MEQPAAKAPNTTDKADEGIKIQSLREAWNLPAQENTQTHEGNDPDLRVEEILEPTHDQAARDVFSEEQKALGKRAIIAEPEALAQCVELIRNTNQCKLMEAMSKEHDILLWGYLNIYINGRVEF